MKNCGVIILYFIALIQSIMLIRNEEFAGLLLLMLLIVLIVIHVISSVLHYRDEKRETQLALQIWERDKPLVYLDGARKSDTFNFPDYYYRNKNHIHVYVIPDENAICIDTIK